MSPRDRAPSQPAVGKPEIDEVEKADKFFDDEDPIAPTAEEKAAYVRKLDFHIMPVIFLIYMLSVLVRLARKPALNNPQSATNSYLTWPRLTGPIEPRQRTSGRS